MYPAEWSGLKKLLMLKAASGGSAPQTETVSGSLVTFETTKARPLTQCRVDFLPKQSGSGDPSPENVRPISGWDGVSVFVSPTTTGGTEYPVTWQSAGTVYGGYADLVRGVLVAEWEYMFSSWGDFGTSTVYQDGTELKIRKFKNSVVGNGPGLGIDICNVTKYKYGNEDGTAHFYIVSASNKCRVYLPINTDADLPIQVVAKLVTPITYTLTPQQITTLIGTNNIWSDAGDVTVTYTK